MTRQQIELVDYCYLNYNTYNIILPYSLFIVVILYLLLLVLVVVIVVVVVSIVNNQ